MFDLKGRFLKIFEIVGKKSPVESYTIAQKMQKH